MIKLDAAYWQQRYEQGQTGWDIGYPSPALVHYFEKLPDRHMRILIPGCGNAHEAAWLFEAGFNNVFLLDIAEYPLRRFKEKHPEFPESNLLQDDFFNYQGQYDLVMEQTFFCALDPDMRPDYVRQLRQLLVPGGRMVGLLFGVEFAEQGPPFGGTEVEYRSIFETLFDILSLESCTESIPPRAGRELFIEITPRS
jgi:SAM-dependent methyltransferase